jgi:hypothetical protein
MNVETEAEQFPEKEYINGIFVAVCSVEVATCRARSAKTQQCLEGLGHERDSAAFVDKPGKI